MGSLKIFVWQSSIDYHAFYTWQSLDTLIEQQGSVTFILGQTENDIRKAQGWNAVDLDKLNVLFLPKEKLWSGGIKLTNLTPPVRLDITTTNIICGLTSMFGFVRSYTAPWLY
jgi:hypothetical protein